MHSRDGPGRVERMDHAGNFGSGQDGTAGRVPKFSVPHPNAPTDVLLMAKGWSSTDAGE